VVLFPIVLGVRPKPGAENSGSSSKKTTVEKTLRRDDFTCRFCGFHSQQYQHVIACGDAGAPPFATVCTFCEQCMQLERTGITGAGLLIWLPEIQQADLNHLARAIYVARVVGQEIGNLAALATRALDALTARRAEAKKRLGSDDPLLLATVMHESLSPKERVDAAAKLDGVRLLPAEKHIIHSAKGDVNNFPEMIRYWCSPQGPYGTVPINTWSDLFKKASAGAVPAGQNAGA